MNLQAFQEAVAARLRDIPLLAANLGLKDGQTLGAFRPLTTADVEAILRLCV